MLSQMNMVSNECGLDGTWSQMKKSHVNVVSNECLKRTWSQMNRSKMNVVSNVVVSNERVLK